MASLYSLDKKAGTNPGLHEKLGFSVKKNKPEPKVDATSLGF